MRRELVDLPPVPPLRDGLELRPCDASQYRVEWDARTEAFRDHWGFSEPSDAEWQRFLAWPGKQPQHWQIAWDITSDQIAGGVHAKFFADDNAAFGMLRGWTDPVYVRRPWRKRGLARALLIRALQKLRELGMTEATLGVDTQNPNGALGLYESIGFAPIKRSVTYRKPLEPGDGR
jgi:GNAT superfamily N-acetyltransferase